MIIGFIIVLFAPLLLSSAAWGIMHDLGVSPWTLWGGSAVVYILAFYLFLWGTKRDTESTYARHRHHIV